MTDPVTLTGVPGDPYLAVDVIPDVITGTFVLDESELDGPDLLAWSDNDPTAWQNIVCDVQRLTFRRGATRRVGVFTQAEAGNVSLTLSDTGNVFDPIANPDVIHKGTPLRVRAWGFDPVGDPWESVLFTGEVDDLAVSYSLDEPPLVTIAGVDLIAPLSRWESEGRPEPGVGAGDSFRQRVIRVLGETGLGGTMTAGTLTNTTVIPGTRRPDATTAAVAIRARILAASSLTEGWTWTGCPAEVRAWGPWLRRAWAMPGSAWAATHIAVRLESGATIAEDWTWKGSPDSVPLWNDYLLSRPGAPVPGVTSTVASIAWLDQYVRNQAIPWLDWYISQNPAVPTTVSRVTTSEWLTSTRVSPDSDTAYATSLAPTTLAQPWQDLLDAQQAELGRLWVDRDGRLVVRARGSLLSGPVRGTLSDVHGEADLGVHCCMADAAVAYGTELMTNRVMATRMKVPTLDVLDPDNPDVEPVTARRDDEASQARHGLSAYTATLAVENDPQAEAWAEAVIVAHTQPELRVDSVSPRPSPTDLDSAVAAWPAVLATDLGDRWLFRYHPAIGPTVERAVGVVGIELEATPEGWTVAWTTEDAPAPGRENPLGWVTLDVSELDSQDLLAPYAVAG